MRQRVRESPRPWCHQVPLAYALMTALLAAFASYTAPVAEAAASASATEAITCRYPTLCAEFAVAINAADSVGGGRCEQLAEVSGRELVPCSVGLDCVHPRAYWIKHPDRWPPEADEQAPICAHTYRELLLGSWPQPGAPQVCQTLTQSVVVGYLNAMVVEYQLFPEPSHYLLTEGERVANDCCDQVGDNEALSRELKRLLKRFNDGEAPAAEGGLPLCPVNETVAAGAPTPYTGTEPYWYHYLFYGRGSYADGPNTRGVIVITAFCALLLALALAGAVKRERPLRFPSLSALPRVWRRMTQGGRGNRSVHV